MFHHFPMTVIHSVMPNSNQGELLIVATPIGHLGDITRRAEEVLSQCDYIAAEDSRHSIKLLNHLGIKQKIVSLHEHNEREKTKSIISDCLRGLKVALISDAGTPLISDPGYYLVREAVKAGVKVSPIPGACAAIAALSVSGLASDRFVFEGFLAAKTHAREKMLAQLVEEPRTLIFYESTHRILDSVTSMAKVFGSGREITLAKELTKSHETVWHGGVGELPQWLTELPERQKGEFVLVVAGALEKAPEEIALIEERKLMTLLLAELSLKQASKIAAEITSGKKNHFYQLGLKLQQ